MGLLLVQGQGHRGQRDPVELQENRTYEGVIATARMLSRAQVLLPFSHRRAGEESKRSNDRAPFPLRTPLAPALGGGWILWNE